MWEVWHDEWAGTFEFLCGPLRTESFLNGGMNTINGLPTHVEVVGHYPALNATQFRVTVPTARVR